MKIKYISSVIIGVALVIIFSSNTEKTTGGHPGSTGAPGELTCAQSGCHADAIVGPGTTVNTLVFGNNQTTYTPGQKYTVKITCTKSGIQKFGFEVCALKKSDNSDVPNYTITNSTRTQIISGTGPNRDYVTHKSAGTPATGPGQCSWTFDWTAPSTNVGDIVFYYATNATNNNNANTGDQVFLSSFTITPASTTSVEELHQLAETIYYNSENIVVNSATAYMISALSIYDLAGKCIKEIHAYELQSGSNLIPVSDLNRGVYIVKVTSIENIVSSKKIIIY